MNLYPTFSITRASTHANTNTHTQSVCVWCVWGEVSAQLGPMQLSRGHWNASIFNSDIRNVENQVSRFVEFATV